MKIGVSHDLSFVIPTIHINLLVDSSLFYYSLQQSYKVWHCDVPIRCFCNCCSIRKAVMNICSTKPHRLVILHDDGGRVLISEVLSQYRAHLDNLIVDPSRPRFERNGYSFDIWSSSLIAQPGKYQICGMPFSVKCTF